MVKHFKKSCYIFLLFALVVPFYLTLASDRTQSVATSDAKTQFSIPVALQNELKDYKKNWIRLTQLEPSGLHWNQGIVVYINKNENVYVHNYKAYRKMMEHDEDEEEVKIQFKPYPPGTILLKENYTIDDQPLAKPASVTLMIKREKSDDPTSMDNWRFVQFDTHGNLAVDGSSQNPAVKLMCTFCHQSMADRDYVFATLYTPKETR